MKRLTVAHAPDIPYREIIDPDEVITGVDMDGTEEEVLASSWLNDHEARACTRICNHLRTLTKKSMLWLLGLQGRNCKLGIISK